MKHVLLLFNIFFYTKLILIKQFIVNAANMKDEFTCNKVFPLENTATEL
jgi:hypothetical protein